MPQIQGYVHASYSTMIDVFGPGQQSRYKGARVQWALAGGTVLFDFEADGPLDDLMGWHIAGWSPGAVDQVIGLAVRAGRFEKTEQPASKTSRETVYIEARPAERGTAVQDYAARRRQIIDQLKEAIRSAGPPVSWAELKELAGELGPDPEGS